MYDYEVDTKKLFFYPAITAPRQFYDRPRRQVIDPHEKMTMYAQSVTLPIGAEGRAGNAIAVNISMNDYFRQLNTQGLWKDTEEHSPQFDFRIQYQSENGVVGVKACYKEILLQLLGN